MASGGGEGSRVSGGVCEIITLSITEAEYNALLESVKGGISSKVCEIITLSSTEAGYNALSESVKLVMYLRADLADWGLGFGVRGRLGPGFGFRVYGFGFLVASSGFWG